MYKWVPMSMEGKSWMCSVHNLIIRIFFHVFHIFIWTFHALWGGCLILTVCQSTHVSTPEAICNTDASWEWTFFLDSYRPVDLGQHWMLAGLPSSAPLTGEPPLLSPSSILCQQVLALVGPSPNIFSVYQPGSSPAVHVLLSSPYMVGVDDFQFHLFWHRKGYTWAHWPWW